MNLCQFSLLLFPFLISACSAFDPFENAELIEPMVGFYKNLNEQQFEEFIKITSNQSALSSEFQKELKEFIHKNEIRDAYKSLRNSFSEWKDKMLKMAPENLSGPALTAFNKIKDHVEDKSPNATMGEQCQRLHTILEETEPMVRNFVPRQPGDFLCLSAEKKRKLFTRMAEDLAAGKP